MTYPQGNRYCLTCDQNSPIEARFCMHCGTAFPVRIDTSKPHYQVVYPWRGSYQTDGHPAPTATDAMAAFNGAHDGEDTSECDRYSLVLCRVTERGQLGETIAVTEWHSIVYQAARDRFTLTGAAGNKPTVIEISFMEGQAQ
jgi:hypothetical protein